MSTAEAPCSRKISPVKQIREDLSYPNKGTVAYYVCGTCIFFLVSMVLNAACVQIPEYFTGSTRFENFFLRQTFNTEYLSLGNWVFYMAVHFVGYAFVNIVNLNCERKNPFYDQLMTTKSCVKMFVFILPLLFFWSAVICLRG